MKLLTKKIIVIVGPTASGKSDLAILLARHYNGEIISADSRQVYRGMDLGTGKVPGYLVKISNFNPPAGGKISKKNRGRLVFISETIPHWLIDIASPKRSYNVTHFVRDAKKALVDIKKRGKVPIICGGTGFWAQALIEDTPFPAVKPDVKLRVKLGKKSAAELFTMLAEQDPARAETIDRHNQVRLIRALEICQTLGTVPSLSKSYKLQATSCTIIALHPGKETLKKNIESRLAKRLRQGMIAEVRHLHANGVSWRRLESFGLEYRNVALFLQKKISRQTMCDNILRESVQYAKRQLTWLRRWEKVGTNIRWITDPKQAAEVIAASL